MRATRRFCLRSSLRERAVHSSSGQSSTSARRSLSRLNDFQFPRGNDVDASTKGRRHHIFKLATFGNKRKLANLSGREMRNLIGNTISLSTRGQMRTLRILHSDGYGRIGVVGFAWTSARARTRASYRTSDRRGSRFTVFPVSRARQSTNGLNEKRREEKEVEEEEKEETRLYASMDVSAIGAPRVPPWFRQVVPPLPAAIESYGGYSSTGDTAA